MSKRVKVQFSKNQRRARAIHQGGRCFWCLSQFYPSEEIHGEHVFPESQGGEEWVASCVRCNLHKGVRDFAVFYTRRLIELAKLHNAGKDIYELLKPIDTIL